MNDWIVFTLRESFRIVSFSFGFWHNEIAQAAWLHDGLLPLVASFLLRPAATLRLLQGRRAGTPVGPSVGPGFEWGASGCSAVFSWCSAVAAIAWECACPKEERHLDQETECLDFGVLPLFDIDV